MKVAYTVPSLYHLLAWIPNRCGRFSHCAERANQELRYYMTVLAVSPYISDCGYNIAYCHDPSAIQLTSSIAAR